MSSAWLRLLHAAGTGNRRWIRALRAAGSASALTLHNRRSLRRIGLRQDEIERLENAPDEPPKHWERWLAQADRDLICFDSERYPEALGDMDDAPLALWVDGKETTLLQQPQVAVVGSRHPTRNGRETARALAARLSASGITVTSGLALGIDAASHCGAVDEIGRTIAVLGSGIDCVYPEANRALAARIRSSGLIISEYPPGTPVRASQFPQRNRIIAGLALGTLVVEATRRSGSLITARIAVANGREVFAVPGSIHNPLSKGCHELIRNGAKLVENVDDVLIEIAPQLRAAAAEVSGQIGAGPNDAFPAALAGHLDFSPVTLNSLAAATGLTAAELSSMLLHLEIQGKIEALPGGRYCRLIKRA